MRLTCPSISFWIAIEWKSLSWSHKIVKLKCYCDKIVKMWSWSRKILVLSSAIATSPLTATWNSWPCRSDLHCYTSVHPNTLFCSIFYPTICMNHLYNIDRIYNFLIQATEKYSTVMQFCPPTLHNAEDTLHLTLQSSTSTIQVNFNLGFKKCFSSWFVHLYCN